MRKNKTNVSNKSKDLGFNETDSKSFQLDKNEEHSFELK